MEFVDKIYIISLEKHKIRKQIIISDLTSAGFDMSKVEWVTAVDGNDLDIKQNISDGIISDKFFDPGGILTKSIYGCALSHQNVYKKFLETSDDNKYALILEDDARITEVLLKVLNPKSPALNYFENELKQFMADVVIMGGQEPRLEYIETPTNVLLPVKRYPKTYAGHSYLISKQGAKKLIDSNSPIQFAADVNIYCCMGNVLCTPVSYFTQKVGKLEKHHHTNLKKEFELFLLIYGGIGDEELSTTTHGDYDITEEKDMGNYSRAQISNKIEIGNVNWNPVKLPNGDVVENWINIKLKS